VPTCPAELRDGEVWVRPAFGYADPAAHWCQRIDDGLGHVLGLVIAKAVYGQLAAGVPPSDVVRQVALSGIQNRDGGAARLVPRRPSRRGRLRRAGTAAAACCAHEPARSRHP